MKKTVWHKGPPPEIGWWPASLYKDKRVIRWWDGKVWSRWVESTNSAEEAGELATYPDNFQHLIRWTERWWLK